MSGPASFLSPVLQLLSSSIEVLPATGGAIEDLPRPDQEEIDDVLINKDVREVTAFHETPEPSTLSIYRPTPPLHRNECHLFRFFIDGSLRTYFVATGIEGPKSFPIELAQIGSAALCREDNGNLRVLNAKTKLLLLVPRGSHGLSDTVWEQLQRLPVPDFFEIVDTTRKTALTPRDAEEDDPRTRAGGIARHRMHELEIKLIESTEPHRNEQSWLILDGAVKLQQFVTAPYLVGVAKSFRKDPQFFFGRGRRDRRDVTAILAGLPYAHRTAAFMAYDGQVAFWYVRIREQKEVDYPLMGVVKVELPRPDRTPVPADLADLVSCCLVAERSVTPYGLDRRWHCHLYPIYVAEQTIKSRFLSDDVLMGAIRWPKPTTL